MVQEIGESKFEEKVLKAKGVVLVDFYAPWCGPCQQINPITEELNSDLGGKVKFFKVNIDKEPKLADKFQVMSLPTIFVFKSGEVKNQLTGTPPKNKILEALELNE